MAEMVNNCKQGDVCLDNRIHVENDDGNITSKHETTISLDSDSREERNKKDQPSDDWFPITQSRRGNSWTATFHLLSSGIGIQTLSLPLAFVYMGWFWGILCLSLAFVWQLYTIGLLVNLHESVPDTRYSRYLQLSIAAFGEKFGKIFALLPVMYLSGGTCVLFIITGGQTMKLFYQLLCGDCSSKHPLTTTEWFLVFICLAILVSLFLPNFHSVALVSFLGAIMAVGYCTILWVVFVAKGRVDDVVYDPSGAVTSEASRVVSILNALGIIAVVFRGHNVVLEIQTSVGYCTILWVVFVAKGRVDDVVYDPSEASRVPSILNALRIIVVVFSGHNVVLEIQGTMPSTPSRSSSKPMWKGIVASYLLIATCFFPFSIIGYWSFGNKFPSIGGLLTALSTTLHHRMSKPLLGLIYVQVVISCVTAFQIYSMVVYDSLERAYVSRTNHECSKFTRMAIRIIFGGFTFFISVAFLFLQSLSLLVGGIALHLTFGYPSLMWLAIKRPPVKSVRWWLNLMLGCLGTGLNVLVIVGAVWNLVCRGLDANFFHPR